MLSPLDKLLMVGGNNIIQIVVTTSCDLFNCSNCTQLLLFRKDYLHMSLPVFREACRTLADWPGIVAMFGGNPCSHPQFPELCQIMTEMIPDQKHRGLWSNNLMGHGQIVHDTFFPNGTFNLNVHTKLDAVAEIEEYLPSKIIESSKTDRAMHSAILANWRDFDLNYPQWVDKREQCDINRNWSAAVVERHGRGYAYFCEVAAAIDGVRESNSGMLLHWGWWKHRMDALDFNRQVRNCCDSGCGVPLRIKGHQDLDNTYDVSRSWLGKTNVRKGKVAISTINNPDLINTSREATDYMGLRGE